MEIYIMKVKRTKNINIRLTETEHNEIKAKSFELDLAPSTFLRIVGLDEPIPQPLTDRQLLAHISRIGGNLNQVAKRLNQGDTANKRMISIIAEAIKMTREIRDKIMGNRYIEDDTEENHAG